jgi:transposase
MHPRSLFSLAEHLERLSKDGDPLEVLARTVEFESFRPLLVKGLGYSDGARGGRPAFDPVAMFKVLVVQAQHDLSDARMEFMIRDRLSWMRFFGFDLGKFVFDAIRQSAPADRRAGYHGRKPPTFGNSRAACR